MIAIVLNFMAFAGCVFWFHKILNNEKRPLIIPVVWSYLGSVLVCLFLSFAAQHDYLDGAIQLVVAGIFLVLFWLWTTIAIIVKHIQTGNPKRIWIDLAQNSLLVVFPLLIASVISNMSFKIGG